MKNNIVNLVHLSGWLTVEHVETIPVDGHRQPEISIYGLLHTRKPRRNRPSNGSYPVLLTGRPARIVMDWARSQPELIKLAAIGRLLRRDEKMVVLVRYVEILDVETGPLED